MTDNEKEFEDFVASIKFDDTPDPNHRDRLELDLLAALAEQAPRQPRIWRAIMKIRMSKMAAAAVIALIVLGGVSFWPGGGPQNNKWWLGPSAVWGQEIINSLEKMEALVYRVRTVFVGTYGSTHISGNWRRCYKARNGRREDTYYDDKLVGIQWNVPDGDGEIRYDVSFEYECYTVHRYEGGGHGRDPVSLLRFYVDLFIQGKADRELGTQIFEERECVGFEISASKYGSNPKEWIDRIWFDVDTKLPVRIEKHGRPVTDHPEQTFTFIEDEFEYCVQVPADMFTPEIPEGFVNKHPDEIRAALEREEKGEMTFAEVPEELTDGIMAALRKVETAAYRDGSHNMYLSKDAWRRDLYSEDHLQYTQWFVIEREDSQEAGFDFDANGVKVIRTSVDFGNNTWSVGSFEDPQLPGHPMDCILFLVGLVGRADRILENQEIDRIKCFGFEISAKKYGTNPDGMLHRLWFDTETKLPVRMEFERPREDGTGKNVRVRDQFEWNPELPADTFTPYVPEGFRVIKKPSEP